MQTDDYGAAFGPFASLQNLFTAQDEQFYARAAGAEAVWRHSGRGTGAVRRELRLFAEWQQGVGTQSTVSVPWLFNRARTFNDQVIDTLPFARGATDLSLNRALTSTLRATVTISGGTSTGTLPVHRWSNIGGWQTVRGLTGGSSPASSGTPDGRGIVATLVRFAMCGPALVVVPPCSGCPSAWMRRGSWRLRRAGALISTHRFASDAPILYGQSVGGRPSAPCPSAIAWSAIAPQVLPDT